MAQTFDRELAGELELVDRNTLTGRVVPWGEPAEIFETADDGRPLHYRECFDRGAFDRQIARPGGVAGIALYDQHTGGLGKIGYALELVDDAEALLGTFRVFERHVADVRQMYDDGISGLSARFVALPRGSYRDGDGVVHRRAAFMEHAAIVAAAAYASAGVAQIRDAALAAEAEAARVAELAELDAWLEESRAKADRWRPAAI